ncbi:class I SAM-dependent methyltransferase [Aquimarina sp. MMG016]|uniref:class I SAM-dependent methyltransferase n=1 Tax=Aquimarina sp. MMG016 TaxID=2822690 RepID=UPI001B3A22C1|nr:class I SAM-dependent methyltransferase [Aquimarina sp. MMG016]MBQ4820246.1 class I SAM-dependent methyltransferase [Aquimarina sp. MMG016]
MDYHNKPDNYYNNTRHEMLTFLPKGSKTVLDIGCGEGAFSGYIKEKYNAETWGIELMPEHGKKAEKVLDKVFIGECEKLIDDLPDNYFDAIYFNDVLEHLVDPYWVLEKIKSKLSDNGVIISSIPNIRYHSALKSLVINKNWEYKDNGVMDKTHLRFFTGKSIANMYKRLGYKIITHKGINRTKSIKPYFYNIPFLFTAMDMWYLQYATVVKK